MGAILLGTVAKVGGDPRTRALLAAEVAQPAEPVFGVDCQYAADAEFSRPGPFGGADLVEGTRQIRAEADSLPLLEWLLRGVSAHVLSFVVASGW
jgi:hypothetical protein